MTINLIQKGLELTPAIKAYVEEKMQALEKYLVDVDFMDVEVGMTTHHHQKGDVFFCKVNVNYLSELLHVEEERADLYEAIDCAKDTLKETILRNKDRLKDKRKEGAEETI
ncbi:ribosome-associated translation inhibitor RaiA [Patescibacteria group bacterium]|nr:ribosome-associated translation inhibitor RaiA [Patescibacteria group bacterium]MBP9709668.1 ribosome-associated translation inhibitor RaiA [Patescibacteria group bacterium]